MFCLNHTARRCYFGDNVTLCWCLVCLYLLDTRDLHEFYFSFLFLWVLSGNVLLNILDTGSKGPVTHVYSSIIKFTFYKCTQNICATQSRSAGNIM